MKTRIQSPDYIDELLSLVSGKEIKTQKTAVILSGRAEHPSWKCEVTIIKTPGCYPPIRAKESARVFPGPGCVSPRAAGGGDFAQRMRRDTCVQIAAIRNVSTIVERCCVFNTQQAEMTKLN